MHNIFVLLTLISIIAICSGIWSLYKERRSKKLRLTVTRRWNNARQHRLSWLSFYRPHNPCEHREYITLWAEELDAEELWNFYFPDRGWRSWEEYCAERVYHGISD